MAKLFNVIDMYFHTHRPLRYVMMLSLALAFMSASAHAQVAISLQNNNSAAIPNSQRSYYANITGTTNQGVNWSVTGGCSLSSTTGTPVVVTAPATGGRCAATPNPVNFTSPVTCQITATAQDTSNGTQSASTTLPVCAPSVSLSAFPQYTVLYKGQNAVIQSALLGSTDTSVTWALTSNPGGHGAITGGTTNRHAIFSATASGVYTLTATSVADPTKTASSTIYVTNNAMPVAGLADHTEPVDCTAVGSGTTYDVGPTQDYTDLNQVPWTQVGAGDTVRIHNDDVTGSNPTVYHQIISLPGTGIATQPLRICGVPDANGVKPIIDGNGATTRADANWAGGSLNGSALFVLYDSAHKFDVVYDGNQNVIIEGLHFRNANPNANYVPQGSSTPQPYIGFAACIRLQTGRQILIRGNDFESCSQAIFSNSVTPQGGITEDVTIEGNYIHNWGTPGWQTVHGMYLQDIGLTVQFNYFGAAATGVPGNVIKTRSVMDFLRWNYISQPTTTTARALDMVEPQAFNCYIFPGDYYYAYLQLGSSDCLQPNHQVDPITPDDIAANFEAYHSDYVYGNIMDDTGSGSGYIHYGYDQQTTGAIFDRRGGTLYSWNNTHYSHNNWKVIVETAAPDVGHSAEFPIIESVNNIFAGSNTQFIPSVSYNTMMNVDTNWLEQGYKLPYRNNSDTYMGGTTAAELATCDPYGQGLPFNGHMSWLRDHVADTAAATLYTGSSAPFNTTTFVPASSLQNLATTLPAPIADQPSNMEYNPSTSMSSLRLDMTYLGALDQGVAGTGSPTPAPAPAEVATMVVTTAPGTTVTQGTAVTQTVTLTGTNGVPTGNLVYSLDGSSYTVAVAANGVNSFTVPSTTVAGTHTVVISYAGDRTYTSGVPSQTITLTVTAKAVTPPGTTPGTPPGTVPGTPPAAPASGVATMVLTPSATPAVQGQPFSETVTLTGNNGVPTGILAYKIDGISSTVSVGPKGLNIIAFPTTMAVGSHDFRISYQGSKTYPLGSTEQHLTITVVAAKTGSPSAPVTPTPMPVTPASPAPTPTPGTSPVLSTPVAGAATMVLTPSAAVAVQGQPFNLTVKLSGGNGVPGGTLAYSIDGTSYSVPVGPNGVNTIVFPTKLTVGDHYLRISYQGSRSYPLGASQQRMTITVVGTNVNQM